jgi:uncharacterized protein YdeI (YjbR/CyaY-like superfamily)
VADPENSIQCTTRMEWRKWLSENYERGQGVWLITYKPKRPELHLSYEASVEEAVCYGWVDSKVAKVDDERGMLWFAPRKPQSLWSRSSKERIQRLEAQGLISDFALDQIAKAKANGTWFTLDAIEDLVAPDDLQQAFGRHPGSEQKFAGFPPSSRREILVWIVQAKKPETRAARVEETARLASQGVRAR